MPQIPESARSQPRILGKATLRWITGRHGWVLPWVVFVLVLSVTAVIDRQWVNQRQADRRDAESRALELKLEPVDLQEVLTEAVEQVAPIAGSKGLDLEVVHGRGKGGEKLVANADRKRLTQVVLNLLSNAIKFTDGGGVTLRSDQDGDGFVEVRVRDTGSGISEDQQERIFEEFYQVEGGLTRKAGGTGLGLAITRRFARLMGGDVTVKSRLGEGSEFVVKVPAAHEPPTSPEPALNQP